jgi:hypothetical protein
MDTTTPLTSPSSDDIEAQYQQAADFLRDFHSTLPLGPMLHVIHEDMSNNDEDDDDDRDDGPLCSSGLVKSRTMTGLADLMKKDSAMKDASDNYNERKRQRQGEDSDDWGHFAEIARTASRTDRHHKPPSVRSLTTK